MVGQTAAPPRVVARFDGPLPAPIVKGTPVGTAAVTMPDGRVIEYQLQAGADVARVLFFIFIVVFLILLVLGLRTARGP